jgi:uroporphyrin-III C-methyltransferase
MISTAPHRFSFLAAFRAGFSAFRETVTARPVSATREGTRGKVSLVGAGPGSADLITLRGLQRLQAADVVFYDRLADPALLCHAKKGAACIDVGKRPGCHAIPQDKINAMIVEAALGGLQVVRLKCGDPGIFARGAEEAAACEAAGVVWEIVPGVTSAAAAAASAKQFLTERGLTERLILATGHLRHDGVQDWRATAQPGTSLACYMGVAQAGTLRSGLLAAGWPKAALLTIVSKAQTAEERVIYGSLDDLERLCTAHPGLNPAMLLLRWPLDDQTQPMRYSANPAKAAPAST